MLKSLGTFIIGLFIAVSGVFGFHKSPTTNPSITPPQTTQLSVTSTNTAESQNKNTSPGENASPKINPVIPKNEPTTQQGAENINTNENVPPQLNVQTNESAGANQQLQATLSSEVGTLQNILELNKEFLLDAQNGIPQTLSQIATDYSATKASIDADFNSDKDSLASEYSLGESYLAQAKDQINLSPARIKSVEDNYTLTKSWFETSYQDELQQLEGSYNQCTSDASTIEASNTNNFKSMSSYISAQLPIIKSELDALNKLNTQLSSPLSSADITSIGTYLSQNFPESQGLNYYDSSEGTLVKEPQYANGFPPDATAQCNDGVYSFSENNSGTCSGHGGVHGWLYGPQASDCLSGVTDLPLDDLQSQLGL
jgi:hypothetical protein